MDNSIVKIVELNINEIIPNRFQPRRQFDEDEIMELSDSIKKYGVIQPLVVRPTGDKYEIIAGERRYKASVLAGLETVPVIIKNLTDKDSAEIAIIENIQRRNLSAIEEALSYKKVLDMGYLTQEDLATKLGKSQPTIANKIRLLNLSDEVQEALLENKISERHARSLLRLTTSEDQNKMLEKIINERLTVRKTDEEIEKIKELESGKINMNEENIGSIVPPMEPMSITPSIDSIPAFDMFGSDDKSTEEITQPISTEKSEFTMPQVPAIPEVSVPAPEPIAPAPQPEFTMPQVPVTPEVSAPAPEPIAPTSQPEFTMPQVPATPEVSVPAPEPIAPTPQPEFTMPQVPATPEVSVPVPEPIAPAPQPEFTMPTTSPIIEQPEPTPIPQPEINVLPDPTPIEQTPETLQTVEEETQASEMNGPIIVTDYSKQYDPVMPAAVQPVEKAEFKEVIDAIRECSNKIEQYGYVIDVEEYDLANLYQVVFKVEK